MKRILSFISMLLIAANAWALRTPNEIKVFNSASTTTAYFDSDVGGTTVTTLLMPMTNNAVPLGTSSFRFSNIFSVLGDFSGALASTTLNTGQGANELYAMNQAVQTSNSPTFAVVKAGNSVANASRDFYAGNSATTSGFRASRGDSATEYFEFIDLGAASSKRFNGVSAGAVEMWFDLICGSSSQAQVSFFRSTNTSSNRLISVFRGDASATIDHQFVSGSSGVVATLARNGGFVGIGDTTPDYRLDVQAAHDGGYAAYFSNLGDGVGYFGICIQAGAYTHTVGTNRFVSCWDGDGTNEVGGLYTVSGTMQIAVPSDRKLKTEIEDTKTSGALTLEGIRVRDYIMDDGGTTKTTGFIAQELEQVYPAMVGDVVWPEREKKNADGTTETLPAEIVKVTYPMMLIPVLVKASQEQGAQIRKLEARVAALEGERGVSVGEIAGGAALLIAAAAGAAGATRRRKVAA